MLTMSTAPRNSSLFDVLKGLIGSPVGALLSPTCSFDVESSCFDGGWAQSSNSEAFHASVDSLGQSIHQDVDSRTRYNYLSRKLLDAAMLHVKPVVSLSTPSERSALAKDRSPILESPSPLPSPLIPSSFVKLSTTSGSRVPPGSNTQADASFQSLALSYHKKIALQSWRGHSWSRLIMHNAINALPGLLMAFRERKETPALLVEVASHRMQQQPETFDPFMLADTVTNAVREGLTSSDALTTLVSQLGFRPTVLSILNHSSSDLLDAALHALCSCLYHTSQYYTTLGVNCLNGAAPSAADAGAAASVPQQLRLLCLTFVLAWMKLSASLSTDVDGLSSFGSSLLVQKMLPLLQTFAAAAPAYFPAAAVAFSRFAVDVVHRITSVIEGVASLKEHLSSMAQRLQMNDSVADNNDGATQADTMLSKLMATSTLNGFEIPTKSETYFVRDFGVHDDESNVICAVLRFVAAAASINATVSATLPPTSLEVGYADRELSLVHTVPRFLTAFQTGGSKYSTAVSDGVAASTTQMSNMLLAALGVQADPRLPEFRGSIDAESSALCHRDVLDGMLRLPCLQLVQDISPQQDELWAFASSLVVAADAKASPRGLLLRACLQSKTPLKGLLAKKTQFADFEVLLLACLLLHGSTASISAEASDPTTERGVVGQSLEGPWRTAQSLLSQLERVSSRPVQVNDKGIATVPPELSDAFDKLIVDDALMSVWGQICDFRRWLTDRFDNYKDAKAGNLVPSEAAVATANGSATAHAMGQEIVLPGFPIDEVQFRLGISERLSFLLSRPSGPTRVDDAGVLSAMANVHNCSHRIASLYKHAMAAGYYPGFAAQSFLCDESVWRTDGQWLHATSLSVLFFVREGWLIHTDTIARLATLRSARARCRMLGVRALYDMQQLVSRKIPALRRELVVVTSAVLSQEQGCTGLMENRCIMQALMLNCVPDVMVRGAGLLLRLPTPPPLDAISNMAGLLAVRDRAVHGTWPVLTRSSMESVVAATGPWTALSFPLFVNDAAFVGGLAAAGLLFTVKHHNASTPGALTLLIHRAAASCAARAVAPSFLHVVRNSSVNSISHHLESGNARYIDALWTLRDQLLQDNIRLSCEALHTSDAISPIVALTSLVTDWTDRHGFQALASSSFTAATYQSGLLRLLIDRVLHFHKTANTDVRRYVDLAIEGCHPFTKQRQPWYPTRVNSFKALLCSGILSVKQALLFVVAGAFHAGVPSAFIEICAGLLPRSVPSAALNAAMKAGHGARVVEPTIIYDIHDKADSDTAISLALLLEKWLEDVDAMFVKEKVDVVGTLTAVYEALLHHPSIRTLIAVRITSVSISNAVSDACALSNAAGSDDVSGDAMEDSATTGHVNGVDKQFERMLYDSIAASWATEDPSIVFDIEDAAVFVSDAARITWCAETVMRYLAISCCHDTRIKEAFCSMTEALLKMPHSSSWTTQALLANMHTLGCLLRFNKPEDSFLRGIVRLVGICLQDGIQSSRLDNAAVQIAAMTLLRDVLPECDAAFAGAAWNRSSIRSHEGSVTDPGQSSSEDWSRESRDQDSASHLIQSLLSIVAGNIVGGGSKVAATAPNSTLAGIAVGILRKLSTRHDEFGHLASMQLHEGIVAGHKALSAISEGALQNSTVRALLPICSFADHLKRFIGSLAVIGGWRAVAYAGVPVDVRLRSDAGSSSNAEADTTAVTLHRIADCSVVVMVYSVWQHLWTSKSSMDSWLDCTARRIDLLTLGATANAARDVHVVMEETVDGVAAVHAWDAVQPTTGRLSPSSDILSALFLALTPPSSLLPDFAFVKPGFPQEVLDASSIAGPSTPSLAVAAFVSHQMHLLSLVHLFAVAATAQLLRPATPEGKVFAGALGAAGVFTHLLKVSVQPLPPGFARMPAKLLARVEALQQLVADVVGAHRDSLGPCLPRRSEVCGKAASRHVNRGPHIFALDGVVADTIPQSSPAPSPPPTRHVSAVSRSIEDTPPSDASMPRWGKAGELVTVLGGPSSASRRACYAALEKYGDDADTALLWLFENPEAWAVKSTPVPTLVYESSDVPSAAEALPSARTARRGVVEQAVHIAYGAMKSSGGPRPSFIPQVPMDSAGAAESAAEAVRFDECITEGIAFNEPLIIDLPTKLPVGYTPAPKFNVYALTGNRTAAQALQRSAAEANVRTAAGTTDGTVNALDDADPGSSAAAQATTLGDSSDGAMAADGMEAGSVSAQNAAATYSHKVGRIGVHESCSLIAGASMLVAVAPAVPVSSLKAGTLVWVSTFSSAATLTPQSIRCGNGYLCQFVGVACIGDRVIARVRLRDGSYASVPTSAIRLPLAVANAYCCNDDDAWVAGDDVTVRLPPGMSDLTGAAYLRTASFFLSTAVATMLARQSLVQLCVSLMNASGSSETRASVQRTWPMDVLATSEQLLLALKLLSTQDDTLARDSGVMVVQSKSMEANGSSRLTTATGFSRSIWLSLIAESTSNVAVLRNMLAAHIHQEETTTLHIQWQCARCTVLNTDTATCNVCGCAQVAPPKSSLSHALVDEAIANLSSAADVCAVAGERAVTKMSNHPLALQSLALDIGTVTFEDATVLWVTFDSRCETDTGDDSSYIEFYAEDPKIQSSTTKLSNGTAVHGSLVSHLSGAPHMFTPFMVRAKTLTYVISKGRAKRGVSGDGGWGLQFTITPLSAMLWASEVEVYEGAKLARAKPAIPSLLWGCWLLDFLLSGALTHEQLLTGLVHNSRLVGLCIDYMRTTAAPHKEHIAALLHKLISSTEYTVITPVHCDFPSAGTAAAIETLRRLKVPPAFGSKDESEVLQPLTIIPLRFVEVIRHLLNSRLSEANAISSSAGLFPPKALQRLVELVAIIESALRRARVQMHMLLAVGVGMYAPSKYDARSILLKPLPSSVPAETRLVLSIAARSDRDCSIAPYFTQTTPPTPSSWVPSLVVHCPPPVDQLIVSQALLHLRDILVALITQRRAPDGWVAYALLTSQHSRPISAYSAGDIAGIVTLDKLAWAHMCIGRFECTPAANEAICAWVGKCASRKGLASALDVQPSELDVQETDSAAFPVLGSWPVGELRVRAAFILLLNSLIQKVLPYIDMSHADEASVSMLAGAPAASSSHALHRLSLGAILRRIPQYILVDAKEKLISDAIKATETPGPCTLKICLDNRAALACSDLKIVEPLSTLCMFAQLYRYFMESRVADKELRHKLSDREYLFEVVYVGLEGSNEDGKDWGGLYRDSLVRTMEDLFSQEQQGIDLFAQSPNAVYARSSEEAAALVAQATQSQSSSDGSFVPNPKYAGGGAGILTAYSHLPSAERQAASQVSSPYAASVAVSMFEFVGRLMGISIRTRACLDFDIAPLIWKMLVEDRIDIDNIISIDSKLGTFLRNVRDFKPATASADTPTASAEGGISGAGGVGVQAAFTEHFGDLRFVMPDPYSHHNRASTSHASVVQVMSAPLVAAGEELRVTFANRLQYVNGVIDAVCNRYRAACRAMRKGITAIIPDRAIRLASWRDLQRLVCGEADIDLDILKRNTAYDSRGVYSDSHPNIRNFWAVMETLTPEQKRNFVRFAWGRSRLPRGAWPKNYKGEQVKFKIVPKTNDGLPLAHTCFFLIELPNYSSIDIMRQRLLTAITYGAGESFLIA